MSEEAASLVDRSVVNRRLLRYGGWSLLALLVAFLILSPARTGRVPDVISTAGSSPEPPGKVVAAVVHPPDPNLFTAESMKDAWPFAGISSATVECRKGMYAVIIADNGTTYALDAAANRAARTGDEDFIRIDAVLRKSSDRSGLKMSIAPLLDRAATLCR